MQELGHEKQRRLKAQLLWDILEPDTFSKSAQSSPGGYFRNLSMPHGHLAVISEKSRRAISSLGCYPQNNPRGWLVLSVASKTLTLYSIARHYF
jgi:hypothetical protein